ncbi:hypothetical protein D3C87_1545010 [compost metagenome]
MLSGLKNFLESVKKAKMQERMTVIIKISMIDRKSARKNENLQVFIREDFLSGYRSIILSGQKRRYIESIP